MSCILVFYLAIPAASTAGVREADQEARPVAAPDDADALYRQREDLANARKAASIWEGRAAAGQDYEAAWKLARARYYIGTNLPEKEQKAEFERGMAAGKRALGLEPGKPEGHFWYGANLGMMAQVSGMMTGLKYKNEIKSEFEKVIAIAPGWQAASAESALGQWYIKVPGNFLCCGGDDKKGIEWLRKAVAYDPNALHARYALAEALADDKKTVAEARALLQQVIDSPVDPDWAPEDRKDKVSAAALLAKLNKK